MTEKRAALRPTRLRPIITSANAPEPETVARAGAAFLLEFFNARRRSLPPQLEGQERRLDRGPAPRARGAGPGEEPAERVMRAEDALADARVAQAITEDDVRALLAGMASAMADLDREALKDALRGWLSRVELDPASRAGRITYRLDLGRDKVASPRRAGAIPVIAAAGPTFIIPRHRRARAPLRL